MRATWEGARHWSQTTLSTGKDDHDDGDDRDGDGDDDDDDDDDDVGEDNDRRVI